MLTNASKVLVIKQQDAKIHLDHLRVSVLTDCWAIQMPKVVIIQIAVLQTTIVQRVQFVTKINARIHVKITKYVVEMQFAQFSVMKSNVNVL